MKTRLFDKSIAFTAMLMLSASAPTFAENATTRPDDALHLDGQSQAYQNMDFRIQKDAAGVEQGISWNPNPAYRHIIFKLSDPAYEEAKKKAPVLVFGRLAVRLAPAPSIVAFVLDKQNRIVAYKISDPIKSGEQKRTFSQFRLDEQGKFQPVTDGSDIANLGLNFASKQNLSIDELMKELEPRIQKQPGIVYTDIDNRKEIKENRYRLAARLLSSPENIKLLDQLKLTNDLRKKQNPARIDLPHLKIIPQPPAAPKIPEGVQFYASAVNPLSFALPVPAAINFLEKN